MNGQIKTTTVKMGKHPMSRNWSPTPWEVYVSEHEYGRYMVISDGEYVEEQESPDLDDCNANRIEECVNACEGTHNPKNLEAFLQSISDWIHDPFNPELREKAEEWFDTLGHYYHTKKTNTKKQPPPAVTTTNSTTTF